MKREEEKTKENKLVVFQDKKIRRTWYKKEWYFSVIDIINALEASSIPKRYWSDLKAKLATEGFEQYDNIVQLKLPAEDNKLRLTDCASTKNMFRIIQSIPSKKAEPFKQWLAQVGYERIGEIKNPEIGEKSDIASQSSFKTLNINPIQKQNLANKLCSLALNLAKTNKKRHQSIQDFFLIIEQLTIYALALASKTKLPLTLFKCAWFDENNYFEFFPLHVVKNH